MGYIGLCPHGQPNNNDFFFSKWNCYFDAQLAMLVHTVHYKRRLISETSYACINYNVSQLMHS